MDPRQISRFSKLLRDNGDKVLNSQYKLTLTGALLRALNDSFSLIVDSNEICTPQTFQVLKPNNASSDVFRELQFIYDFVQKTQILCLASIPNDDPYDGQIDISKFRNLRRLEIQRIPIEQIVGLQKLRTHLQEIICMKSLSNVADLIAMCGGDKANGFTWNELKLADFSYNRLRSIDNSMEFVSNLQHLNLSHNQIVSVDAIKWLPNLKKLNLSYNSLTHIPSCIASRRLQTLILTNNFIEDLSGLARMDSLNELNLADNCILDHSALHPLSTLIALQVLHLHGNPISCHLQHRELSAKYLHKNTLSVKFILDFEPMNKQEKRLVGYYQKINAYLSPRSRESKASSGISTPRLTKDNSPANSIGSMNSFDFGSTNSNISDSLNSSTTSLVTKKLSRRLAKIGGEDSDDELQIDEHKTTKRESVTSINLLEMSSTSAHLEMKKEFEEKRKMYGSNWLTNTVPSTLSIASPLQPTPRELSPVATEINIDDIFNRMNKTTEAEKRSSTPIAGKSSNVSADQFQSPLSNQSKYESCVESSDQMDDDPNTKIGYETDKSVPKSFFTKKKTKDIYATPRNEPEHISDPEDDEMTYFVTNQTDKRDMILLVSEKSLREKDKTTLQTTTKWNMSILESCERLRENVLRLCFDTLKRERRERTYQLEKDYCQKLENFLRNILSKRPLSEMKQTIYRCINCLTQFSRETNRRSNGLKCPNCKGQYFVEIKEEKPSSPKQPSRESSAEVSVDKSDSQSITPNKKLRKAAHSSLTVIAISNSTKVHKKSSASSFNETSSKISSDSQSSFDSNQSLIGSTTNCDEANDLDNYFNSRFGGQDESDIEVLSNPSISSIEVLENFSRQSSRKPSIDRRYMTHSLLAQPTQSQVVSPLLLYKSMDEAGARQSELDVKSNSNSDIEELPNEQFEEEKQNGSNGADGVPKDPKKTLLTGINLTESSSSGSVTDSICTTYENQTTDGKLSDTGLTTSSTTTASSNNDETISPKIEEKTEIENGKPEEVSTFSSMFGGLTIKLMSRNQNQPLTATKDAKPVEKFRFSYTEFDNVDHRLKLFLYQNIFEDENEHLKWLVKGKIFRDSTANSECDGQLQSAIIVMSTTKWYLLHIIGSEQEDISKWLKNQRMVTIDRIEMVRVLPYKIGITFSVKFDGNIHMVLQDISQTDSLLLFFANNPLPCYCTLEYQISERLSQKLLLVTDNAQLKMLAIMKCCQIRSESKNSKYEIAALIITDEQLYLTSPKYEWLADKLERDINVLCTQQMKNIDSVDRTSDTNFTINYTDETENEEEKWHCSFETIESAENTFQAIAQPWEKLFQVPLAN